MEITLNSQLNRFIDLIRTKRGYVLQSKRVGENEYDLRIKFIEKVDDWDLDYTIRGMAKGK